MSDSYKKIVECIGFIIASTKDTFTVVLPEKPFGKLKIKLPQKEKKVDAEFYDKYELKAFSITVDESGSVIGWSFKNVLNFVEQRYFVALLADRNIIADDGRLYKVWDNRELQSNEYASQFDWAFSAGNFDSIQNVKLLIRNGIIYAMESCRDYKFRNSWSIEDALANYLNNQHRYSVRNNAEERDKLFDRAKNLNAFNE